MLDLQSHQEFRTVMATFDQLHFPGSLRERSSGESHSDRDAAEQNEIVSGSVNWIDAL
jgi:hypothetical protein